VGVRDCKNKWWLVAWVYQSPVGQDHLFVFAVLRVINPSCSFQSCENVKGETPPPPPLRAPRCCESPASQQTPTVRHGGARRWPASRVRPALRGRAPAARTPHPGGCACSRAHRPLQSKKGQAWPGHHGKKRDFMVPLSRGWPHFHVPMGQCWRQFSLWLSSHLKPQLPNCLEPRARPAPWRSCPSLPFPPPQPLSHRP